MMSPARKATPPAFSPREFRASLGMFATGVTIVTARTAEGDLVGLTANSFNSVSLEPPLVLWSLARAAGSLPAFSAGSHYAINILAADQKTLAERFARRGGDRWTNVPGAKAPVGRPCWTERRAFRVFQPQPLRRRRPCHLRRRGGALQPPGQRLAFAVSRRQVLHRTPLAG
jgi:flavin reductase (DIM6/NTAB) family NADH-FMN oxidoreductase RutF